MQNATQKTRPATPETILFDLSLNPKEAKGILLSSGASFTVEASKNNYRRGFAILVKRGGSSYSVGGFKTKPSKAALAEATQCGINYGLRLESDPIFRNGRN